MCNPQCASPPPFAEFALNWSWWWMSIPGRSCEHKGPCADGPCNALNTAECLQESDFWSNTSLKNYTCVCNTGKYSMRAVGISLCLCFGVVEFLVCSLEKVCTNVLDIASKLWASVYRVVAAFLVELVLFLDMWQWISVSLISTNGRNNPDIG